MEPEGSLPHSQKAATCPYPEPHPTSGRSILIVSSHLRQSLPSGLLPSGVPTKYLYAMTSFRTVSALLSLYPLQRKRPYVKFFALGRPGTLFSLRYFRFVTPLCSTVTLCAS